MKHSSFDAISALDAETSALGVAIARRSFDATISALDAVTSSLDAETLAIGDCGVGITPQMCNRVTNDGDMGTFPNLFSSL